THGWDLDTLARSGRALTSVCKNDYGRSSPYNTTLWIAFSDRGRRRSGAQLFVRLDAGGVRYGLRLGREALPAREALSGDVERHREALLQALRDSGALARCSFGPTEHATRGAIEDLAGLRAWARGRSAEASVWRGPGDDLLGGEGLVGEVLLTFDALLPV